MRNMDSGNMVKATVRQIAERSGVGEATVKRLMAALRKPTWFGLSTVGAGF